MASACVRTSSIVELDVTAAPGQDGHCDESTGDPTIGDTGSEDLQRFFEPFGYSVSTTSTPSSESRLQGGSIRSLVP